MPQTAAMTPVSAMSQQAMQIPMAMQAPPQLPEPEAKLLAYIRQRKSALPPDVQQEMAKHEGAKATQDLFTAAEQMTRAKEDYEHHKLRNGDQLVGRLICREFWASQKVLFEQKVSRANMS